MRKKQRMMGSAPGVFSSLRPRIRNPTGQRDVFEKWANTLYKRSVRFKSTVLESQIPH